MNAIRKSLTRPRRLTQLAALTMTAAATLGSAYAQTEAAAAAPGNYAEFQASTMTGTTNTINVTWLPVVTATGISYYNVTLPFTVNSSGGLTAGKPQVVPAPVPQTSSFRAGNYVGPANVGGGKSLISVSGPGVAPDGSTVWTLAASPGGWIYSYPDSATWYVVGSLSSSPLASRLQAANITSMDYSYGTVGSETFNIDNNWYTGTLIGVSQVGNALTIVSFTNYSSGKDQSTPVDQITYTLTQ